MYENQNYKKLLISGFDESGRGSAAGPIVVAAVILNPHWKVDQSLIKDSKKLSIKQRLKAYDLIIKNALDYVIIVKNHEIVDQKNPKQTTIDAFENAFLNLNLNPEICLIDYEKVNFNNHKTKIISFVKGEEKSFNIAAASILAKVTRDQIMDYYHLFWSKYNFSKNKGYLTSEHLKVLNNEEITSIHRKTYKPIKNKIGKNKNFC
jgi:ribonuclease HII